MTQHKLKTDSGTLPSPKVVWITGAAGGLGQGLVAEFAQRYFRVVATYHHQIPTFESDGVLLVSADVTKRHQVQEVLGQILDRWGRLDVLVNNAGLVADRLFWQMSESDWDVVMAVNLKASFLCSQAAFGPMVTQSDGHILNIGSFVALHGARGQANYAAAKAGLLGLSDSLAKEGGAHNVRVNSVLPGVLSTPMTARLTRDQMNVLAAANALGRINSVEEVARFVGFLATMRNVSGQVFQLDSRIGRWS